MLAMLPDVTKAETGDVHDMKRRLERRPTKTRIQIFDIQIARRKVCVILPQLSHVFLLLTCTPTFSSNVGIGLSVCWVASSLETTFIAC